MAAIADADVSINAAGDIRWTGAATTNRHTVLEFIQFLMDKQDDEQAAGDDLLDITVETPFDRSTDQIVALNFPFNIDDTFSTHLYDGSVSQTNDTNNVGNALYSGLSIIGPVETNTEYMVVQDGKVLAAFWGTGINPEASPSLVFSRHLIKSRDLGADIDGKRITVLARELGDQFRRFPVTLGTGNSVAAIGNGADIFNTSSDATIAAFTTIVNTEGFQELDIDGTGASGQEFYSQWDTGSQTVNDTYERTKWISQRAHTIDSTGGTPTGADFVIDNATIVGQGQEFQVPAATEQIVEIVAKVKILAGAPTGDLHAELWLSDGAGSQLAEPTGAVLARSEPVLASAITSTYEDVIFRFNRLNPNDGTNQLTGLQLTDDTNDYFAVFRHPNGGAGDNFSLEGSSTDQDSTMNQADDTAAVWTASATDDINIVIKSCPIIHTIPGETFQGINIEVGYDAEGGTGVTEDDMAHWGTDVAYDGLSGTFQEGEYVKFIQIGDGITNRAAGKITFDDGSIQMIVSLETVSPGILNNDTMTGLTSGATADVNIAPADQAKLGGEGLLLAIDDNGTTGEVYLSVVSGVNPVDNSIIYNESQVTNSATATATLNTRTIIPEYLGTSTGSNIIGAYGIGFVPADVGSSDRFTSLDNTSRIPPNNVIFTVSGLVSGEDRVLVGPRTGTALDRAQWLLSTGLTGGTETAVVVKTGTDTVPFTAAEINWPATGQAGDVSALRIELDTGIYRNVDYESHDSTDTFTILSSDFSGVLQAAVNNDVFLAFIDLLAVATTATFTGVHTGGSDRDLFVRSRDGGTAGDGFPTKTFESDSAQFLATPQTITISRQTDV